MGASFAEVLAAAQKGDAGSIAALWRSYAPAVAGYARLAGAADPDDLTSEVFLGALRTLRRFAGDEAQFRSWLFTIAYRRLVDERRRQASRVPPPEPAVAPSAEEVAAESLASQRVVELCGRLVPAQREVLALRLVAGLTVDEVAKATGRSPGAVKALQRRGLAALSKLIRYETVPL